jgi:hypothetical protein
VMPFPANFCFFFLFLAVVFFPKRRLSHVLIDPRVFPLTCSN